ncbi:zinc finger protein 771-like [Nasonia vitripennis]|uniref:C2H2-type domain-containing protein n=1 Tax=Nasonia vitripennis TaxID=7425 RepID=A0A7M7HAQ7_NASVI|nr:zinc finger protein 771-like [Nasonia vitripennis]
MLSQQSTNDSVELDTPKHVPNPLNSSPVSEDFYRQQKTVVVVPQPQNKPFGCPKCSRSFTVKGNMTRHLKYECGQQPRFQCPYCDFRSKQTSNVMSHIRTKHVGEKVYVVHLKYNE